MPKMEKYVKNPITIPSHYTKILGWQVSQEMR